jgi:hypothetical protein
MILLRGTPMRHEWQGHVQVFQTTHNLGSGPLYLSPKEYGILMPLQLGVLATPSLPGSLKTFLGWEFMRAREPMGAHDTLGKGTLGGLGTSGSLGILAAQCLQRA